jgi:2-polyprenyl-3-methyl-5-hydroxy-6-metoxy-1,4-benzoquinol methylase
VFCPQCDVMPTAGQYGDYAIEYAAPPWRCVNKMAWRDPCGIWLRFLEVLGDVVGQSVIDAGCGKGHLARVLADRAGRLQQA